MSKKLFIGLAAVGGGLYYYDQNVQPIFSKSDVPKPIANRASDTNKEVHKDLKKLDAKSRDFGSQLKKTVSDLAADIKAKTESTVAAVKDTETYNKWSKKIDNYTQDVQLAAEEVEQKPVFSRMAAKYIDFINKVGQTEDEKLKELASSTSAHQQELKKELQDSHQLWSLWWPGKKAEAEQKADELKHKAEKEKDSWMNWGSSKKSEAENKYNLAKSDAEKEKNQWVNWGSAKKAEGEQKADQLKADAEKEKDSWVTWGSAKKDEASQKAQDASHDLQANYEKQKKEWSNSFEAGRQSAVDGYYKAKNEVEKLVNDAKGLTGPAKADHERHLEAARKDLLSAAENLKKYGSDLLDKVTGEKK